ncbi:sensor histidine kinase [Flavobacterium columnare]|uniref:sensor histidine kinase n=1 Tax=Flavobacterium columnare TaxID=996 RepID=UPI0013E38235|nr:histidine kinase [Flavobacterium columnare]MCH4830292.1 histidine kinase [Flavobacterium columnare]
MTKIKKRNQLILDKINLEKNVNQSNLRALKSQMNPHFFFNALNTLQSYIVANEKNEAIEYLSKFSNLTRIILEMTDKDWISIADEVKTLKLYLEIEKARFEEDFLFSIKTQADLDVEAIKIPSMLLQPYVENALKHGLLHKFGIKELYINFTIKDKILSILIEDNGIGRKKSQELNQIKNKKHQSFATNALQNRIDLLNEYNQKNISIEIIDKLTDNKLPNGTLIVIQIPL